MTTPVNRFIVPTAPLVEELISDLASMTIADYDLDELLTNAVNCLQVASEATSRTQEMALSYLRWSQSRGTGVPHDGEILARAWVKFVNALSQVFAQMNAWYPNGVMYYYYERLHYHDMVVALYPE